MGKTIILHLSDLHIRQDKDYPFDEQVVLDPLIERVKLDRDKGLTPELIMVTGDISFKGDPGEYGLAATFLDCLRRELDLGKDRVFIVPGNHDVDRNAYRPSEPSPSYNSMRDLDRELGTIQYRQDLFRGLKAYFDFIEDHYEHLAPLEESLVPFAQIYQTRSGKTLGLLGLNSAWKCRKSPDCEVAAIGEFQLKKAKEILDKKGPCDLYLACFHHPLDWLWEKDRDIARKYLKDFIILTGHLHNTDGGMTQDAAGRIFWGAAGAAYLGSDTDSTMGYHYLSMDWENGRLIQNFRTFDKKNRRWVADGFKGEDSTSEIPCPFIKPSDEKKISEREGDSHGSPPDSCGSVRNIFEDIPENYCELLKDHCNYMEADHLQETGKAITLSLPELFIPLYVDDPEIKAVKGEGSAEHEIRMDKDKKPVDIEMLIGKKQSLVITGKPGSGKTTLLKHLTYTIADKKSVPEALAGFFPALIFLKRLSHGLPETGLTLEMVFEAYYTGEKQGLASTALAAARQGQCLFMLDGLDEIGEPVRNALVDCLGDFRRLHPGNKYVLAGRPHGISSRVRQRFEENQVMVKDLDQKQTMEFVRKWFTHLFAAQPAQGTKRADDLIRQMASNEQLKVLVDTPLMLTAVCILYHHGKRLPKHRAELYQRFTDHLIHNRFDQAEKVKGFLSSLAHQMQEKHRAETDRKSAVDALRSMYARNPGESPDDYRIRTEKEFDRIEPRCGLLEPENGAYKFRHLTFQEFLAAVHIMDTTRDYIKEADPLWYLDHYRETLALFIALLNLNNNKRWANDLVREGLALEPKDEFLPWRTAIRGFLDIHQDRQDPDIAELARQKIQKMIQAGIRPELRVEAGRNLCALEDPRDLKAWVHVPAGVYRLSAGRDGKSAEATLEAFDLGQYLVTNAWYGQFMEDGGYAHDALWTKEGLKWRQTLEMPEPTWWRDKEWNLGNHPVVGICWYEAQAFCNWLTRCRNDGYGYRLPCESEWEAAAAGPKGRKFPWGETWQKGICNSKETGINKTTAVGIFPGGATPEGLMDMAGNVWEWTCTDFHHRQILSDFTFDPELQALWEQKKWDEFFKELKNEKCDLPVLRGGSWVSDDGIMACRARYPIHPGSRSGDVGFRIARTKLTL